MDWQNIETAPRDGTLILIWEPAGQWRSVGVVATAQWDGEDWYEPWSDEDTFEPTHWMPLPNPPAD